VIQSTGRAGSVVVPVEPLYVRVIADIIEKIREGEWPVGTVVPKPDDLADYYTELFGVSVSAGTIRRSIERLQDRGILVGHQGKNVTVARVPE
jgi:GntR family transcriptional regulator